MFVKIPEDIDLRGNFPLRNAIRVRKLFANAFFKTLAVKCAANHTIKTNNIENDIYNSQNTIYLLSVTEGMHLKVRTL